MTREEAKTIRACNGKGYSTVEFIKALQLTEPNSPKDCSREGKEMITEDYVSFETAKLLKEKGFKEWCFHCYGYAVYHKGVPISFDEECDLKDEGLEYEIEYVEGGHLYDYSYNNSEKDTKVWAAPTLWAAMKWLREAHKLYVVVRPYVTEEGTLSLFDLKSIKEKGIVVNIRTKTGFSTYEEACEAAIKYCLENLL